MTEYNTMNAIPSSDVRDLLDNATVEDNLVNGPLSAYPDRMGVSRKSWAGMESEFNAFLAASGFETTVLTYTDGVPLQVDRPTQLLERASAPGTLYSIKLPSSFPVVLSGTWATDVALLVVRVDADMRAIVPVTDVTELRLTEGRGDGDIASLLGYYSDAPGYGGGIFHWSAASVATDDGGSVFAVSGVVTGRWLRADIQEADVYMWGAKQATESSDAIQAAVDWVRARGYGTVNFGDAGFFLTNKPIKGMYECRYAGKAIIRAQSPFSTVVLDVFGGGTTELSSMFYFVDTPPTSPSGTVGTIGDTAGSRRTNIQIDESLTLDCDDIAGYGVFLDNYQYYNIACRIKDPTKWGIRFYIYGWTGSVSSKITGPAEGGVWFGGGCNGVDLDGLLVWGDSKIPTIAGVLIDGDNNGISFAGATIEKVTDGILLRNGFGPIDVAGIDFEQIERHVVYADGTTVGGRVNGPVTITGCFLETNSVTEALVKAINANVSLVNNRLRNAAKIFDHTSSGTMVEDNNVIEASVLALGNGSVMRRRRNGRALADEHYSPVSTTLATVRETRNYGYPYANLVSSGMDFSHQVTSGGNRTMVSSATWYVDNFNLDVSTGRMGLTLNFTTGTRNIEPETTGNHNLGTLAKKFDRVVANSHVQAAGVAVGVNPLAIGEMVMQFTSNTQVTIKGMGSDGVTRTANITLA